MNKRKVIVLCGSTGVGKTYIADKLCDKLKMRHIDRDSEGRVDGKPYGDNFENTTQALNENIKKTDIIITEAGDDSFLDKILESIPNKDEVSFKYFLLVAPLEKHLERNKLKTNISPFGDNFVMSKYHQSKGYWKNRLKEDFKWNKINTDRTVEEILGEITQHLS